MSQLNDSRFIALRALGFTGATNDMLVQWAQSLGASSNQINDAVLEALLANGATSKSLNDAWLEAMDGLGLSGSRNDVETLFWDVLGGVFTPPAFRVEIGDGITALDGVTTATYTRTGAVYNTDLMQLDAANTLSAAAPLGMRNPSAIANVIPDSADLTQWTNSGATVTAASFDAGGEPLSRLQIAGGSGNSIAATCVNAAVKAWTTCFLCRNPNGSTGTLQLTSVGGIVPMDVTLDLSSVGTSPEFITPDHPGVTVTSSMASNVTNFDVVIGESGGVDVDCEIGGVTHYNTTDDPGEYGIVPTSAGAATSPEDSRLTLIADAGARVDINGHIIYAEFTVTKDILNLANASNASIFDGGDPTTPFDGIRIFIERVGPTAFTVWCYKRTNVTSVSFAGFTDITILGTHKFAIGFNNVDGVRGSLNGGAIDSDPDTSVNNLTAGPRLNWHHTGDPQYSFTRIKTIKMSEDQGLRGAALDAYLQSVTA